MLYFAFQIKIKLKKTIFKMKYIKNSYLLLLLLINASFSGLNLFNFNINKSLVFCLFNKCLFAWPKFILAVLVSNKNLRQICQQSA